MKAAFSLLILVATINFAHAGSFAGPPPFTNQSPLQSGTDGTYQAIASETNLTGVFSFVIKDGIQTSDQNTIINGWVFFVDGNIFQGSVVAAISQSKVSGILSGGTTQSLPTGTNLTLPAAFIVPGDTASGEFSGNILLNSPEGIFGGEGTLQGTPERVDQLVVISEPTASVVSQGVVVPGVTNTVTVTNIRIPESSVIGGGREVEFDFQGTRVSTTPATPPAPSPSPGSAAAAAAASPSPSP
jgi:hypothetical protein